MNGPCCIAVRPFLMGSIVYLKHDRGDDRGDGGLTPMRGGQIPAPTRIACLESLEASRRNGVVIVRSVPGKLQTSTLHLSRKRIEG
jgi:hypothetical protein